MKKTIFTLLLVAIGGMTTLMAQQRIWLLGDGTMASPIEENQNVVGWGDALATRVQAGVALKNLAAYGLNLNELVQKGGLDSLIVEKVRKDILLIQVGQNDLKETNVHQYSSLELFTERLLAVVNAAQAKKMQVVLCTPIAQPYYKDGVLIDRLGGYAEAVRRVAVSSGVLLVDVEQLSKEWIASLGEEGIAAYYVGLDTAKTPEGEYLLNEAGAQAVAKIVADALLATGNKMILKVIK